MARKPTTTEPEPQPVDPAPDPTPDAAAQQTPPTPAAAPLDPPVPDSPAGPDSPAWAPPRAAEPDRRGPQFLGYVDDAGNPLDPDDLFDMSGTSGLVVAKHRTHTRSRPQGVTVPLTHLMWTKGQDVPRGQAVEAVARAKALTADNDTP